MSNYIIKDTTIINEGQRISGDVLIKNNRIERVGGVINTAYAINESNAINQFVLTGCYEEQVHLPRVV